MKTGFFLCTFHNREKPVFITGIPANVNIFFLYGKSTQGKPCSGPVLALYGIAVQKMAVFRFEILGLKPIFFSVSELSSPSLNQIKILLQSLGLIFTQQFAIVDRY